MAEARHLFGGDTAISLGVAVQATADGDGDQPVLHEAAVEGRIAGRDAALYPALETAGRPAQPAIVFTDPGIARIVETGMTLDAMIGMPFYHPTFEEGLRGALEDARKRRG